MWRIRSMLSQCTVPRQRSRTLTVCPLLRSASCPQEFGDGIMSAIDMFATIEDVEGKLGEKRLVLTLNGKVSSVQPVAAHHVWCRVAGSLTAGQEPTSSTLCAV